MSGRKMTGFARLLLFLVLFVPTVVFGVLFAKHGEEGLSIDKAIELFSGTETTAASTPDQEIAKLQKEIKALEQQIKRKEDRIEELQQ